MVSSRGGEGIPWGERAELWFGPNVNVDRGVGSICDGEAGHSDILRLKGIHERARGLTPFR